MTLLFQRLLFKIGTAQDVYSSQTCEMNNPTMDITTKYNSMSNINQTHTTTNKHSPFTQECTHPYNI